MTMTAQERARLEQELAARREAERAVQRLTRESVEREQTLQEAVSRGRRLLAQALVAEDNDRARLVQMLHDYALQSLLAARQDLEEGIEGDARALVLAQRGLETAIAQMRETLAGLHPVAMDHAGLATALRGVATEAGRQAGATVQIDVPELAESPVDVLVLSVVRELLQNVVQHANASSIEFWVTRDAEALRIVVADDGDGFDGDGFDGDGFDGDGSADPIRRGQIGLASARERVRAVGGRLDVATAVGEGTRITVTLPV